MEEAGRNVEEAPSSVSLRGILVDTLACTKVEDAGCMLIARGRVMASDVSPTADSDILFEIARRRVMASDDCRLCAIIKSLISRCSVSSGTCSPP